MSPLGAWVFVALPFLKQTMSWKSTAYCQNCQIRGSFEMRGSNVSSVSCISMSSPRLTTPSVLGHRHEQLQLRLQQFFSRWTWLRRRVQLHIWDSCRNYVDSNCRLKEYRPKKYSKRKFLIITHRQSLPTFAPPCDRRDEIAKSLRIGEEASLRSTDWAKLDWPGSWGQRRDFKSWAEQRKMIQTRTICLRITRVWFFDLATSQGFSMRACRRHGIGHCSIL